MPISISDIVCPENPAHGASFCQEHRLTKMGPTAWGSFSIVYETIRALCQLSAEYDAAGERWYRVFLLSGYDIPIQDLRAFAFTRDREIVGKVELPDGKFSHSQWMCLTPRFMRHLYDRYHEPSSLLLALFYDCLMMLQSYPELAPDEIWLNFVEYDVTKFYRRSILLPFYHDSRRPISPITWKDLRLRQYRQEDGCGIRMNLIHPPIASRWILFFPED